MNNVLRVSVTQDDIDRGEPDNCSACPIALAVLRATRESAAFRHLDEVDVELGRISLRGHYDNKEWAEQLWGAPLPDGGQEFILAFDAGEAVEPFSFFLALQDRLVDE